MSVERDFLEQFYKGPILEHAPSAKLKITERPNDILVALNEFEIVIPLCPRAPYAWVRLTDDTIKALIQTWRESNA